MTVLRRVVWVLGVVAALAVVGTSAAALVLDDDAEQPRLTLRGSGVSATLPAAHWRIAPADTGIVYRDADGRRLVGLTGPAVYREGACVSDRTLSRAFAGFVPRSGRPLRTVARAWAEAATLDVTTGRPTGPVRLRVSEDRVDADVGVPPGPCNPARQHLTVVAAGDQALVLLRDVGVAGALPQEAAEEIADSVR